MAVNCQTHFTDTEFQKKLRGNRCLELLYSWRYLMCVAWLLLLSQCMVFPWTEPLHLLWEPHQVDSLDTHIHWNSGIQRPKQQTFIFSRCLKQQQIDQRLQCSVIVTKLKTSAEFGSYKALTMKKQQINYRYFYVFHTENTACCMGPVCIITSRIIASSMLSN